MTSYINDSFKNFFFRDYSIFHALDNQRIVREAEQNKTLSIWGRAKKGIEAGLKQTLITALLINPILLALSLPHILKNEIDPTDQDYQANPEFDSFFRSAVTGPIFEELTCRFFLQNFLYLLQKATFQASQKLQIQDPGSEWAYSPSARIVFTGACFALFHFPMENMNAPALLRVLSTALYPAASIVKETTGGMLAPIAEHITHNTITQIGQRALAYLFN